MKKNTVTVHGASSSTAAILARPCGRARNRSLRPDVFRPRLEGFSGRPERLQNTANRFRRIVVKIGSAVLSGDGGVKTAVFKRLAAQVKELERRRVETIIVSSGAVACAMAELDYSMRPRLIAEQQAFAAYGQPLLMQYYLKAFAGKGLKVAQILLTYPDMDSRTRFHNAQHALKALLQRGIVPIINENDSVAVDELKFGDNDRLSALVAHLAAADLLVILSHVDGLYRGRPDKTGFAEVIPCIGKINEKTERLVFPMDNSRGTGGMASKLKAAKTCLEFGIPVFLTNGGRKDCVTGALDGSARGTWFGGTGRTR